MNKKQSLQVDLTQESQRQWESAQENHTEEDENRLLECIKNGDEEALRNIFNNSQILKYPIVLENERRNMEYDCVAAVAIMTKAAALGGLPFEDSLLVNDVYFKKIAEAKKPEEFREIYYEAALSLASLVKGAKIRKTENPLVYSAKKYIKAHITEMISLKTVASHLGFSSSYLCHLFSENEGIGVNEYIIKEKMEIAKTIIGTTNAPLFSVSEYLGYTSLSYFSRLFKKTVGQSPSEYRKK